MELFEALLQVNINLVVTFMVNYTAINDTDHASQEDGPFAWDSVIRNDVMGLFFAGYMTFQMPGGRLAELFGGKRVKRHEQSVESLDHTSTLAVQVLALMMGLVSVLTLLIPEAAKLGGADGYPFYLVAVR